MQISEVREAQAQAHKGPGTGAMARRSASMSQWLALPVILAGSFMVTLDFFIVNVAIPALQAELRASSATIQLIIAGYGLALAAGLITAGRLGDLYGRRRVFMWGLALFTGASLVCGLAPTVDVLILARVAQGLGASLLSPQALSMLGTTYTGATRSRAFMWYGMTLGLAASLGQLIGGLLIEADVAGLGWRACFLINLPVGAIALLLAPRLVPESFGDRGGRLDPPGVGLITLAMSALVLPLIEGRAQGWPLWTMLCLAASAPLFGLFVLHQRRRARDGRPPLVDLTIFRRRGFAAGNLATLLFFMGMASFFLIFTLYLQDGRGLGALASGAVFTQLGLGFFLASLASPRVERWLGRQTLALGAAVMAVSLTVLALEASGLDGSILWLSPALLADGAGMGLVLAPLTSRVLAGVPPAEAGAGAGILTTTQQIANALGVALIGNLFYNEVGAGAAAAFPRAFALCLVALALLVLAVAALVQMLPGVTPTHSSRSSAQ
jgi:EmrB/QacA subfamily drug resistance transporter